MSKELLNFDVYGEEMQLFLWTKFSLKSSSSLESYKNLGPLIDFITEFSTALCFKNFAKHDTNFVEFAFPYLYSRQFLVFIRHFKLIFLQFMAENTLNDTPRYGHEARLLTEAETNRLLKDASYGN